MIELSNFLPQSLQDHLENHLTSNSFPWYFIKDVTKEFTTPDEYYQPGFHHTPFKEGKPHSIEYDQILFLPHLIKDVLKNNDLILHRIRYGMNIRSIGQNNDHNIPHLDFPDNFSYKNYTCLYYVNNSDGDTVIFNETTRSINYTVLSRITPEKGKLCIFDGEHFHASSPPKNSDYRIVMTLNFYDPN